MASLFAYMNGYEVGEYTQEKNGAQHFIYSDSWLAQNAAVPLSLSLPLTDKTHKGDGGPGISTIMNLLSASIRPEEDRKQFMKSVFLFWLLGAIDGHAKNFSIFLLQGGRFHLTPIYDVISAYPLVKKRQLEHRKMKMAMALHGKNTHYAYHEIMPRHWFDEAKKVSFPEAEMQFIIDETINHIESVIEAVSSRLPPEVPGSIADAVFSGMKATIKKF